MKEIETIAVFRSPFATKFGIPRQSGLVEELRGRILFEPAFRRAEAIRGLEDFDYLWLIWGFSGNEHLKGQESDETKGNNDMKGSKRGSTSGRETQSLTVRPPRLGGNERIGVFASRSPFRPNGLGLSCVRIGGIVNGEIEVLGADLMDGTPIYDIKPYIPYADSRPEARGGFTDAREWQRLRVEVPETLAGRLTPEQLQALVKVLEQDPRPHYHDQSDRVYGMAFDGMEVKFRVADGVASMVSLSK